MFIKSTTLLRNLGTLLAIVGIATLAQTALGQSPSPPLPSGSLSLPRPDFHFRGEVGRTYLDSDPATFPQIVRPPKGAPNIVLILLHDVGFGQFSVFGGGVSSPNLEKLAAQGLRYNRFDTTALCSPSRTALLTGRNHHVNGNGSISEAAMGHDGYTGIIPKSPGTVAEILRQNGYATAWVGKNHNTPIWETSEIGPFDRLANGLGFDYFYGFNAGDTSQYEPILYENRNRVPRSTDPNYREMTFAQQKQLGVIPANANLTPRPAGLPAWDSLNADQKRLYARMMEVFAGYGAHVDHEMGRILDAVAKLPDADNTLIIYIVGDNGASAEGGIEGSTNENACSASATTPL
jgi:arylsulfatase A-like enzyme